MPVDSVYTDPFSSSFWGSVKSSFTSDEISSPSRLSVSMDRKRKYVEDENQDISSVRAPPGFLHYAYPDVEPDDNPDFLQMTAGNKRSTSQDIMDKSADDERNQSLHNFYSSATETDQETTTSPKEHGTSLVGDDRAVPNELTRAVPNEISSRAVPNEMRNREELDSILNGLPSRGMMFESDTGTSAAEQDSGTDGGSSALLPMKNLVEKLVQQIKDQTVKDWTDVFSNMECFETAKLEQLDQILKAALAYEAKLKNEKAELRNFLNKLSDVFQDD